MFDSTSGTEERTLMHKECETAVRLWPIMVKLLLVVGVTTGVVLEFLATTSVWERLCVQD